MIFLLAQEKLPSGDDFETWSQAVQDWLSTHGPRLLLIAAVFFLLRYLIQRAGDEIVNYLVQPGRGNVAERKQRAHTLTAVFKRVSSMALNSATILLVIAQLNPSWIGPLLASFATVGIAVGLGTQNLVRDYFSGFVMLLENQYGVEDVVEIAGISGLVERVSLRMTVLRDLEGVVHFIPHGQVTTVTNMTYAWSRALFEIEVAYKEDVDEVMKVLIELGKEIRDDEAFADVILDDPEMLGVDSFGESAISIKFFIKTKPLHQWSVKRELNRRIKYKFDELGIEIPYPHQTVLVRGNNDSSENDA